MTLIMTQTVMIMMMWMAMYMLMFKSKMNPKTMSPFECGYNSFFSKLPMSIQFTMLTFIFLIFDVELSILISANWTIMNMTKNWTTTLMTFMLFMIISILYEMLKMSFKWS